MSPTHSLLNLKFITLTALACIIIIIGTATPLTTSNAPSLYQQPHNLTTTNSSHTLHLPSNLLPLAENVQNIITRMNNSDLYPDFRGKSALFVARALKPPNSPSWPLHATDLTNLRVSLTTTTNPPPNPPPYPYIQSSNPSGWTEWELPVVRSNSVPFNWRGKRIWNYRWEEVQELMSVEEADRRLKGAGYGGRILYWYVMYRGDTEASAKLGYYFGMQDRPWNRRDVLVNVRNGEVTVED